MDKKSIWYDITKYSVGYAVIFGLLTIPVWLGWYRMGDAISIFIGAILAELAGKYVKKRYYNDRS